MTFAKRLFDFIRSSMLNHRKKLIGLALLVLVGYYLKKKMTLERLIIIAEKLLSFAQYLPLPDAPSYRPVHQIEKIQPAQYPSLKVLINIEELKQRIRNKEPNQWDKLKENVLTGYGCVITLFDISEILKILECKYIDEFTILGAQKTYLKALATIQDGFSNNLKIFFQYIKNSLKAQLEKVDIGRQYTKIELYSLLKNLSKILFEDKYNYNDRLKIKKNRKLIDKEVQRLFFTSLEKETPPGKIKRFFNFISSPLESKEIQFQISSQRFQVVRQMFLCDYTQANKLAMTFQINSKSQQLFELVYKQYQDLLESLNFHTLAYYFAEYQTLRFINRLELYMVSKKLERIKMVSVLPVIYKIILEEFINEDSWSKNKTFLISEIKEALKILHSTKDKQINPAIEQEIRKRNIFLNELQALKRIQFAKNQMLLKYFYERSGIEATKEPNAENMDFEAKQLMSFMSREK